MAAPLTVTYELNPPEGTPDTGLPNTKKHEFPVEDAQLSGKDYYEALRRAVAEAKSVLGEELTAWRDAVGIREQDKEGKLPKKSEEEEDEVDEDPEE